MEDRKVSTTRFLCKYVSMIRQNRRQNLSKMILFSRKRNNMKPSNQSAFSCLSHVVVRPFSCNFANNASFEKKQSHTTRHQWSVVKKLLYRWTAHNDYETSFDLLMIQSGHLREIDDWRGNPLFIFYSHGGVLLIVEWQSTILKHWWKLPIHWFRYSFICQGTWTRKHHSDHFDLWVKLPPVTTSLTTQR